MSSCRTAMVRLADLKMISFPQILQFPHEQIDGASNELF